MPKTNSRLLELHKMKSHRNIDDHRRSPWVATNRVEEQHGLPVFGSAFNNFLPPNHNPVFATIGQRYTHVYECPLHTNGINLLGAFECNSKTEDLYTVTWCLDTFEKERGFNPYMLAFAGNNAIIYIVDAANHSLVNRLYGHGGPINEIRTSPKNSNLIATAAKDKTIRIWHIRNDGCLIVLGGHDSHADQILSVDWSMSGDFIISCGMDHSILQWDLTKDKPKRVISNACNALKTNKKNVLAVSANDIVYHNHFPTTESRHPSPSKRRLSKISAQHKSECTEHDIEKIIDFLSSHTEEDVYVPIYYPVARNSDLHSDYVDCLRYFYSSDYIISKGCGKESVIYLSRFGDPKGIQEVRVEDDSPRSKIESGSVKLMQKEVPNGETWFIKFDIDPLRRWLCCGDNVGNIYFWSLKDYSKIEHDFSISIGNRAIRQVIFESEGRVLVAVGDDSSVTRVDRVPDGATVPHFKLTIGTNGGTKRSRCNNGTDFEKKEPENNEHEIDDIRARTNLSLYYSDEESFDTE